MNKSFFITGVDTDIGKTFVSAGMCLALKKQGLKVAYYKPFQSGAVEKNGVLIAPDVEELKKYGIKTKFSYLFKGDVSPHLASVLNDIEIDINKIEDDYNKLVNDFDVVVIEGAGGLLCPAYKGKTFCDIIKYLKQEIIIVTTPDLGRINHTLLTIQCAKNNGIKIKGLVINKIPKQKSLSQINFIKELKMFCDEEIICEVPIIENIKEENIVEIFSRINL